MTKKQYEKAEHGMYGIAWGEEELEKAIKSVHLMRPQYMKIIEDFPNQLKKFVETTQLYFS